MAFLLLWVYTFPATHRSWTTAKALSWIIYPVVRRELSSSELPNYMIAIWAVLKTPVGWYMGLYYPILSHLWIYILYIYGGLSLADHNPWGNVPFANSQWSVRHPAVIHPSRAERGDLTWDFSPWPWLLWWWKAFAGAFLGIVGAWSTDVHGRETRRSNLEWDKGWWHISRSSKCVLVLFGTRMCCQSI
jgi:hypothetical protein